MSSTTKAGRGEGGSEGGKLRSTVRVKLKDSGRKKAEHENSSITEFFTWEAVVTRGPRTLSTTYLQIRCVMA